MNAPYDERQARAIDRNYGETTPIPKPTINSQLSELNQVITELNQVLEILYNNLRPVLDVSLPLPAIKDDGLNKLASDRIITRINEIISRILNITDSVRENTNRLQL